MDAMDFENITAETFRQYQATHGERDYLLVDVRQPETRNPRRGRNLYGCNPTPDVT